MAETLILCSGSFARSYNTLRKCRISGLHETYSIDEGLRVSIDINSGPVRENLSADLSLKGFDVVVHPRHLKGSRECN